MIALLLGVAGAGILPGVVRAQQGPINIFGYFQTSFEYVLNRPDEPVSSFQVQQLNVLLQRDLTPRFSAFVNFEVLNNFSSARNWGSFNLAEAWVNYRASPQLNLRVGLQVPRFNHLNEIKNRTPLLPYIIRPLVYETSFEEFFAIEAYVPNRAFLQVSGYHPIDAVRVDYAVFVGNSPNIAAARAEPDNRLIPRSGVDTTRTILMGGRLGVRIGEFEVGVSATHDLVNEFSSPFFEDSLGLPTGAFRDMKRYRIGADLALYAGPFSIEGEFIYVLHREKDSRFDADKMFYYGTLGYLFRSKLLLYASYWYSQENYTLLGENTLQIWVPNFGVAYFLNENVTVKGQITPVDLKESSTGFPFQLEEFTYYGLAVSVLF